MLPVEEAQSRILQLCRPLAPVDVSPTPDVLHSILAEEILSDLDMPPYDKAMMDGFAVRCSDFTGDGTTLTVIEEVTAGRVPTRPVRPGEATRIMTGAPVPDGADAVVMIEQTQQPADGRVEIGRPAPRPGQNILERGREMRCGDVVLVPGAELRPQELGLLAAVGRTRVTIIPPPRVAVLATGDELVDPARRPGDGEIRNSNGPMLLAQVARAGARPVELGIARDTVEDLRRLITEGLHADVLVLSGGVSAGKLDLVPGVLQELGVEPHFHKVRMKPGKPMFFGTRERTLVFGLPGNPVSSLVCFELFVRPALRVLRGLADAGTLLPPAVLAEDFPYRTDRPTYHPCKLDERSDGWRIHPVPWFGSPDLRGLTHSNAFVLLPEGDHQHRTGQSFPVLRMEA